MPKKSPSRADQYDCGENELQAPACLVADSTADQFVHTGNKMRSHLKCKYWKGEHRRDQEVAFEDLGFLFLAPTDGLFSGGDVWGRRIPCALYRLCERGGR